MICKNCSREIPNDSEYCSFCGNVVESVISSNNSSGLKKECALNGTNKAKKRTVIVSSVCACAIVIALLSYFVLIPLGRNFYYKDLLTNGNVQKAVKIYTNSKWFEYDQKAKDLFYENGLKFVETKDYKNAEACFEITDGYADNEKYLDYCKAQNLLADNDLESYNYFTNLGDFLDSKEILSTNEYFVMVNKLQGEWYSPERTLEQAREEARKSGDYYEIDGAFYLKEDYDNYKLDPDAKHNVGPSIILFDIYSSSTISIDGGLDIKIIDDNLTFDGNKIEIIDDTHITVEDREYQKQ